MSAGSHDALEELVARFLDRREREPGLGPERFVAELEARGVRHDGLAATLGRALAIAATLEAAGAELPDALGPHRIVRELGRGGAGVVYEAERDGRRLALKRVSAAALGPRGLERFRREARLLARLEHPGVVRVVDSGSESGDAWLAMELVEGTPLSALVRAGPLEARRAARIVAALARAVAAVHAAGIVHRDLKPENVLLAEGDRPVLVDFGLGVAEDEVTLTATGALLGTPRYMAPEQARGEAADRRADVYALGLILWELLAGRPARAEASREALLRAIERRPLRARRPGGRAIDPGLARLLAAALAHEPEARLAEAAELADDLERWLAGESVRARPPGPSARFRSLARRKPALAAGVGLGALAVLASVALLGSMRAQAARAAESARGHVERALAAVALGDAGVARAEAQAALRADPSSAEGERLLAAARLAAEEPPARELLARAAALPDSLPALALAAERERAAGEGERASRALERLVARAPELAPAWRALGALRVERGEIASGLDAARRALFLGGDASDRSGELPRVLARAPDQALVRATLEACVGRDAGDAALWFALGWTLDAAHEIEGAERAYRQATRLDERHVKARLCLAHLYSGAQLGVCPGCAAAFERWPALLDSERSLAELLEVLAIDRGASEASLGRVLETALALRRRTGSSAPLEGLLAGLARLAERGSPSPQASARVADARKRLEGLLGR